MYRHRKNDLTIRWDVRNGRLFMTWTRLVLPRAVAA
jgi:hypothetical protein